MPDLFDSLAQQLATLRTLRSSTGSHVRSYVCRCGAPLFFGNTECLTCKSALGFVPEQLELVPLDPGPDPDTVLPESSADVYKYCGNRTTPALCNWLLPGSDPTPLCIACRLNRTIPDLDDPDNARYWGAIETAKRRLVAQLLALGLPVKSKLREDATAGVMFDFLRAAPEGPPVTTGHASGLITMNVEEADDAKREQIKRDLREPYRTLLGHFRHEIGHYYWDALVAETSWIQPFREVFGDERASYAEALKQNYELGPPADWATSYITSYAATHPWEDWAETWAHYLHITDSLGTALAFGLHADSLEVEITPFGEDALYAPDDPAAASFLALLNGWIETMMVLNELARSLGQADFYPFIMSKAVVAKLQLVQMIVRDAPSRRPAAEPEPTA